MSDTIGKVINCQAAIAFGPNEPLKIDTIQVAPPKANEVRVKILYTGVCHSDAYAMAGNLPPEFFPMVLGHEGAGVVESVGEKVTDFQPGDHVIPLWLPQCKQCKFCRNPKSNLCKEFKFIAPPAKETSFTYKGQVVQQFLNTSTFSEYTVVPNYQLCKINKLAPLDKVCLIGCGITTGYGAVVKTCNVEPGSTVAVWGLGGVGLAAVMGAHVAGAKQIVAIDVNNSKEEAARQFGATDFVNPLSTPNGKKFSEYLAEKFDGGFDYTFECCGNVNTMRDALEASHPGWGVACIVGVGPAGKEITTTPLQLMLGRTWKSTLFGGYVSTKDVPKLVEDYMNKKIKLDEFITHRFDLNHINDAFDVMKKGESLRSILCFQ